MTNSQRRHRGGGGKGGGSGSGSGGRSGGKSSGICFEWQSNGTCRFGSSCKFRHDNNNNNRSRSSKRSTTNNNGGGNNNNNNNRIQQVSQQQETMNFIKHLSQINPKNLNATLQKSYTLWYKCWQNYKLFDNKTRRMMVEIVAKIPGSANIDPPPIQFCKGAICQFIQQYSQSTNNSNTRGMRMNDNNNNNNNNNPDQILNIVEIVEKVVKRLLLFEWDANNKEQVKEGLTDILIEIDGCLQKKYKDHRDASKRIQDKIDELEKPWRIKVKFEDEQVLFGIEEHRTTATTTLQEQMTYADWQSATIQWLMNPKFFTPSCLPIMKVPKTTTSGGVYDSAEDYMDTIHQLWVGMTFADGFSALAPHCRSRTTSGSTCQNALYPIADRSGGSSSSTTNNTMSTNLRCRTRDCNGIVEYSCRMKSHDAVCGPCASRAIKNNLGGPGQKASTHIYDGEVNHIDSDGKVYVINFKSRNPPQHTIHWRSSKRLSSPNLVGVVILQSREQTLVETDKIYWGEITFHGKPQDEGNRRQRGELCINMSSIVDFNHHHHHHQGTTASASATIPQINHTLEEGTSVAIIDCMTFVPEWIPVLHALENQKETILPFENGKYLNLLRNEPADITNSILYDSTPEEVFARNTTDLIATMIEESKLEPICEIRRDRTLRQSLQTKLENLVTQTTLDQMQLVSFIDAFRNPVHLTQGPPGTGKSYLGVVIVRALIIIRDLWVKKSKTVGTPPILVLSYKNHAIDEFLYDLVMAEPRNTLMNKLIRIGGQCKDQRLIRYSERNAYQSDNNVNTCRTKLDLLHKLKDSIRFILDTCVSTFLSYRHNIFSDDNDDGLLPEDIHRMKYKAANDATLHLMASLVRNILLKQAIEDIESLSMTTKKANDVTAEDDEEEDNNNDDNSKNYSGKTTIPQQNKDIFSKFSFLMLTSDHNVSNKLESHINRDDENRSLMIKILNEGMAHYSLDHWGDILLKWISGTIPLPLCKFESINDRDGGKKLCKRLSVSPYVEYCDNHLCHFIDCSSPCRRDGEPYCSNHGCEFEEECCMKSKFSMTQLYCKDHCCKRCIQLGVKCAGPATDDPPRNVCEDHPMCIVLNCLEFSCSDDSAYCSIHNIAVVQCTALTKRKRRCEFEAISPDIPYCRIHVHKMMMIADESTNINDDDGSTNKNKKTTTDDDRLRQKSTSCQATTKKGKPCKGTPIGDTGYCYDHSFWCGSMVQTTTTPIAAAAAAANTAIGTGSRSETLQTSTTSTTTKIQIDGVNGGSTKNPSNIVPTVGQQTDTPEKDFMLTQSKNLRIDMGATESQNNDQPNISNEKAQPISDKTRSDDNKDDSSSVSSSSQSGGNVIVDSPAGALLDIDEISIEDEGGENFQHLIDVFEVRDDDNNDDDDESSSDESDDLFHDAQQDGGLIDTDPNDLEDNDATVCEDRITDSNTWNWKMTLDERWDEIQNLMNEQRLLLEKASSMVKMEISSARKELHKARIRSKAMIYENRSVIGGTMVGCISRLESIRSARPFAVVVEEASEVLEPLLFSCLCESTMKLEMIGDHRQLQPSVMSRFDFEILNKINISMFQRLIEAPPGHEVPSSVLSVQRRMRKNICNLTRDYYSDVVAIQDHATCHEKVIGQKSSSSSSSGSTKSLIATSATMGREVPGIGPHIYLWTHSGKQQRARVGLSRENAHEAMMACNLAAYLVECGVPRSSIAILTPYKGQLMLMRNFCFKDKRLSKLRLLSRNNNETDVVRISTVDRFQGDEEDVIIGSLVVDEKSKTSFVKLVNRLIVLLSRARLGLYIIGNVGYFESNGLPKHWATTLEMLQAPAKKDTESTSSATDPVDFYYSDIQTGNEIPLCCPIHRDVSVKVADPSRLCLGFCNNICQEVLSCKHPCSLPCHWPKLKHNSECLVELDSPCQRHTGTITCHKARRNSPGAPSDSDHATFVTYYKCPEKVDLTLTCSHVVTRPCWEENEISLGNQPWPECKKPSPSPYIYPTCKHSMSVTCDKLKRLMENPSLVPKCRNKVTYDPACGHSKTIDCWRREEFLAGTTPYTCTAMEQIDLPRCGHGCTMHCSVALKMMTWTGTKCEELGKVIEGTDYGPKDYDCRELVTFTRSCGHEVQLPCEEAFNRANQGLPCTELVDTFSRSCGHRCQLVCSQEKAIRDVPIPRPIEKYIEGQIPVVDPSLPFFKCKEKISLERKCGHREDIICWKSGKPLQKCKAIMDGISSALCGHEISIPCHLKGIVLWKDPDVLSSLCDDNELRNDAVNSFDIGKVSSDLNATLQRCKKSVTWIRDCGHKTTVTCAELLKYIQRPQTMKACQEQVSVKLDCGHSVSTMCGDATAWQRGKKTIKCTAQSQQKCWNYEWCNRVLQTDCGYTGVVGCCQKSFWTCPSKKHRFEITQCKTGIPSSCPHCFFDGVLSSMNNLAEAPKDLNRCLATVSQSSIQFLNPHLTKFQQRKKRMLEKHIEYLKAMPVWHRPLTKLQLVPCYRTLQKKNAMKAEWFNPHLFADRKTLSGILVKEFNQSNLEELSRSFTNDKITLLVGYAAVARTIIFDGKELPQKHKKIKNLITKMATDGCDSLAYTDKRGRANLILLDPFPLLAVCRLTLSNMELAELSQHVTNEEAFDLTSGRIEHYLPKDKIIFSNPVESKEDGEIDSSLDDASEHGSINLDDHLIGTELEGLMLQLDLFVVSEGIGFDGAIPENVEKNIMQKCQFINPDASPFAGIELLKSLVKDNKIENPLIDLLLGLEFFQHDKKRSREYMDRYIERVRASDNKRIRLHPWALILNSRFDKSNSTKLLKTFLNYFPTQEKYLSEADKAELGEFDDESLESEQVDIVLQQWDDLKDSYPEQVGSDAMEKLLNLTGLKKVKEEAIRLWKTALQLQQMDEEVRKANSMSSNYCFLGNPGTGKTTVARLFAEILCDSKIRKLNIIEEVTAQKAKDDGPDEFRKTIQEAMNGVLFIDEAYDLDPVGDFKGKPIVNELLTLCENDRDSISVILAGYEDDFQKKFFAYNPGLKSRFKEVIFDDFDEVELSKIWTEMRTFKKWEEAPGVCKVVVKRMLKKAGRKGFGNAREVRRCLEGASQSAMARLGSNFSQNSMCLEIVDVIGEDPRLSSEKLRRVLDEVDNKIGWGRIKKVINELIEVCGVNYQRELQGQPPFPIFLNRLFLGNPGTGKTTCAKIYGKLLKELGFLSSGDVVQKTASDFVGSVIGESENRTTQILDGAQGKVLIIDEAYNLDDDHFGKKVLDTLVEKVQAGPADDIAVLLLGYEDQMLQMLRQQNPGLARRFPKDYAFYFDDYSEIELLEILKRNIASQDLEASVEFMQKAMSVLKTQRRQANFGNAGAVDSLVKGAVQKASRKTSKGGQAIAIHLDEDDIEDPGSERSMNHDDDPLDRLNGLFRMEKVREKLERMKNTWMVAQREGDDTPQLGHFVFMGSPGTGKTTVARTIAYVLHGLGLLPSDKIKETSALDLTGDYLGQTKTKVNEALKDAKGGVLFIDEAYNLGFGPYGKEACDTIVAAMTSEEFRDVVIVIAGYPAEINDMLNRNAGLKSRFNHFFEFPDWEPEDCSSFLKKQAKKDNFALGSDVVTEFGKGCAKLRALKGWGNGRDVKTLWDESKAERANRVSVHPEVERSIQLVDMQTAMASMLAKRTVKETSDSSVDANEYGSNFAFQDVPNENVPKSATSDISEARQEEPVRATVEEKVEEQIPKDESVEESNEPISNDNPTKETNIRDDGVADSVWEELEKYKEFERLQMEEIDRKKVEYEEYIKKQREAEEQAKLALAQEQERIWKELERAEQEKALREALEAEERRKQAAELECRRREEEMRQLEEERRKKAEVQKKLQQLRPCPAGFNWTKVGSGWRCGGGTHYVSDEELRRNFTSDSDQGDCRIM